MARYRAPGETLMLVLPDDDMAGIVELEPNPRRKKPYVVLPPGPYDDLFVRVALVRSPDYGTRDPVRVTCSLDVYNIVSSMEALPQESMFVVLLNTRNEVVGFTEAVRGSWGKAMMEPSDIFRAAIVANAPGVIVVHNHPSGTPEPSTEDEVIVNGLKKAGAVLGIKLLDSIIIGKGEFVSMADLGLM